MTAGLEARARRFLHEGHSRAKSQRLLRAVQKTCEVYSQLATVEVHAYINATRAAIFVDNIH